MKQPEITQRRVHRLGGPPAAEDRAVLRGEDDDVAVEEPLEIRVAEEPVAVTMRTPGQDARLAVGFLFGESILHGAEDVGTVRHCGRPGEEGYGNVLEVTPASGARFDVDALQGARRGTLTTAACGVCGRRSVDDLLQRVGVVPDGPTIDASLLGASTAVLRDRQRVFAATGGTHAAAVLDAEGRVLAQFEDVGRHNAVDKVIGELVLSRRIGLSGPGAPVVLAVSGRSSFEIVQKAARARIPVVASVSAASSLAIDLAERCRITLASFVRGDRCNVFTHPHRVTGATRPSAATGLAPSTT